MDEQEAGVRKHLEDRVDEEGVRGILENEAFAVGPVVVDQLQLAAMMPIRDGRVLLEEPIDVRTDSVLHIELRRAEDVGEHAATLVGLVCVHRVDDLDVRRDDVREA